MAKILAIDDKQDNLITISALLKTLIPDCKVITALSGPDGIEKAIAESPDTILLDIKMPGMHGYEVCKRLKHNERTKNIPVIMLTAIKTGSADLIRGLEIGADAYLAKPIDEYVLIAQINTSLRIKEAEDALRGQKDLLEDMVRKKTEALRKSEQQLRAIFEATRDVSFIIADTNDPESPILSFSPGAEKIFGYNRAEIIGYPVSMVYQPEEVTQFMSAHQQLKDDESGFSGETILVRKSGEKFPALFSTYPLFDEKSEMFAALGVCIDISKQKKLEAQLRQSQKMESIGTLASGIAHDFNNILAAIIGYTELAICDVSEKSTIRKNLEEILKAGNRARDLIRQILSFSRKTKKTFSPVQPGSIVKEVLKMLHSSFPAFIEIREKVTATGTIMGDATQFYQVIMNLCTNAYYAMMEEKREGGGILEVSLSAVDLDAESAAQHAELKQGRYFMLIVSDTGQGMDRTTMDKIFDPYFTTRKKDGGTGLGLSVVHGIVKGHGGAIMVYSKQGEGTTFHVYFPVFEEEQKPTEFKQKKPLPTGDERILLVDDEPSLTELGQQMLELLGYNVTTLTGSREALELFRSKAHQFDIVITDMTMPEMTGDRLAQELLKIRPDIPIIIYSGFNINILKNRVRDIGIRKFIMKPLVISELAKAVRDVLDSAGG